MESATFEAKLSKDGSLALPQRVVAELGIHPGDEIHVHVEAVNGNIVSMGQTMLWQAKLAMTQRTPAQIEKAQNQAIANFQPRRTVPFGKTLSDVVSGQWPGDETDEQIEIALRELS